MRSRTKTWKKGWQWVRIISVTRKSHHQTNETKACKIMMKTRMSHQRKTVNRVTIKKYNLKSPKMVRGDNALIKGQNLKILRVRIRNHVLYFEFSSSYYFNSVNLPYSLVVVVVVNVVVVVLVSISQYAPSNPVSQKHCVFSISSEKQDPWLLQVPVVQGLESVSVFNQKCLKNFF